MGRQFGCVLQECLDRYQSSYDSGGFPIASSLVEASVDGTLVRDNSVSSGAVHFVVLFSATFLFRVFHPAHFTQSQFSATDSNFSQFEIGSITALRFSGFSSEKHLQRDFAPQKNVLMGHPFALGRLPVFQPVLTERSKPR